MNHTLHSSIDWSKDSAELQAGSDPQFGDDLGKGMGVAGQCDSSTTTK
jgi:hypothetical protein